MTLTSLLSDTVTIVRPTPGYDDIGGPIAGTQTTRTSAAYVEPVSGSENLAERNTAVGTWRLFLPAGTDIRHTDTVTWGTRTFEVVAEPRPFAGSDAVAHLEVDLAEVT
jgi:head-tail adaptor